MKFNLSHDRKEHVFPSHPHSGKEFHSGQSYRDHSGPERKKESSNLKFDEFISLKTIDEWFSIGKLVHCKGCYLYHNKTKISHLNKTHSQFRGVKVKVIYTRNILVP